MSELRIHEHKIWVDDTPIPLLSGEIHYWRLDPQAWCDTITRAREMGLKIIATYACWDFHEIAPGEYDFHGSSDPRRNVVAFLEMLAGEGFWIIFRPGPYIYSEWRNNGVPDHAAQYHRLDPRFQKLAEHYMAAVFEATQSQLATQGGRIILWQADNEIDPWQHIYTEALGLGAKPGVFQDYLRQQYADIAALNRAWRSDFADFDAVRAVSEMRVNDPTLLSRYNDFRAFLHWYVEQVAAWAVGTYRQLGVDVPILLNTYSGVGTQVWARLEGIADIVGPDIYPSREFLYRTGEHRHILEGMRYASSYSRLPYIPEYEAGIWHDWLEDVGTLTPNHYRLICLAALQGGAVGWNWYMLVNRDNWYQSPINEWGRIRPALYEVFEQITALFHELDPSTLERRSNIALSFDPLQRSTERPGQALLQSVYEADLDYDFFDLSQGTTDKPLLFYAGGAWLSAAGQQRLLDYVEAGGHLVCIGEYPHLDEHLLPLNLLDIPTPAGMINAGPGHFNLGIFQDGAQMAATVESPWLAFYEDAPGEPIEVERRPLRNKPSEELLFQFNLENGARYTAGFSVARGQGRLTVLGLQPSVELLLLLHQRLGLSTLCRSRTPGISSAFFQRGEQYYIIATNPGNESKAAELELAPDALPAGDWQSHDLLSGRSSRLGSSPLAGNLTISIPRKDGTILRLSRVGS